MFPWFFYHNFVVAILQPQFFFRDFSIAIFLPRFCDFAAAILLP
jgi:hypothetical protein